MTRRRAKLLAVTGTVVAAVIGAAYVASIWCGFVWYGNMGNGGMQIFLGSGATGGVWHNVNMPSFALGFHNDSPPAREHGSFCWLPFLRRGQMGAEVLVGFGIPLWIPFLATVVPTALLFRAVRRAASDICPKCGYDLTGAPSSTCPECGEDGKP